MPEPNVRKESKVGYIENTDWSLELDQQIPDWAVSSILGYSAFVCYVLYVESWNTETQSRNNTIPDFIPATEASTMFQ